MWSKKIDDSSFENMQLFYLPDVRIEKLETRSYNNCSTMVLEWQGLQWAKPSIFGMQFELFKWQFTGEKKLEKRVEQRKKQVLDQECSQMKWLGSKNSALFKHRKYVQFCVRKFADQPVTTLKRAIDHDFWSSFHCSHRSHILK